MKLFLIGGMLLFWVNLFSQAPDTLWTKTYGGVGWEEAYSVQQTSEGGYIITGFTDSYGSGKGDCYLIKTNADGDTLWTRTYGGADDDWGWDGQQTSDGGYMVVGGTYSFGAGQEDVWLLKIDANGDTIWTKTYGGVSFDDGMSVQQTSDSGYIVVGRTQSFGAGMFDVYLIKTDAKGDTLWTKTYGGPVNDEGWSVRQTSDGGYIITGRKGRWPDFDVYLIKTDAQGETTWTRTFGGIYYDGGWSVLETFDGGFIVAGITSKHTGEDDFDVYLIKTDAQGETIWTRAYGETDDDMAFSIQQTTDLKYIVAGETKLFREDVWLLKINANGDTIWTKAYGGTDAELSRSVQQTSDGGYIIAGSIYSSAAQFWDVYLIKTEPDVDIKEKTSEQLDGLRVPGLVYGNSLKIIGIRRHIEVRIFDITGREVLSQEVTPSKSCVRLNNLKSGIYFLSIKKEKPELHKFVLIR